MKKKGQNYFLNLLKATRIVRVLPVLIVMLVPVAYFNKFTSSIFLLFLVAIFIYSASSIYNAYKDKDYILPSYFHWIIFLLLGMALIVSSFEKIIFIAALSWMFLGYIYNTLARKIILGDALIAGLTHFALPVIFSSIIISLNWKIILIPAIMIYFIGVSIGPVTNLKDIKKDRKKGYKTLVNSIKKPKITAVAFLNFSFIILVSLYLFLGVRGFNLLFLIPILLLNLIISKQIFQNKVNKALNLMRLYLILSFVFLIFILTSNYLIILFSIFILFVYLLTLKWNIMM